MIPFLPIEFLVPAVLGALILLPVIWWLLRLTPPRPREVMFPPTKLLLDIFKKEETPIRSPWWLTALRLLLAAIIIIALAGPIWRPATSNVSNVDGPVWLLVDNGWEASNNWEVRTKTAENILDQFELNDNPVLFVATADGTNQILVPGEVQEARERLLALEPRPWSTSPSELIEQLQQAANEIPPVALVWLTGGLGTTSVDSFASSIINLIGSASITIYENEQPVIGLNNVQNQADQMLIFGTRSIAENSLTTNVIARDTKGLVISETPLEFEPGINSAQTQINLPIELRNDIARVEIVGQKSAGAVQLIDERWRRRSVGLLAGGSADLAQPLLSPLYYLNKALEPFADVRIPRDADLITAVPELVQQNVSVVMLADIGVIPQESSNELSEWIADGGILVRFAGPNLASGVNELIPVNLRTGDRELGGNLSWQKSQGLASFSNFSPFASILIPDDIEVQRQVLAEPDINLPDRTWASLADGTPLVTAERLGDGWIVLFHVTADTRWSNLPISGTFVEMLQQIVAFSNLTSSSDNNESSDDQNVLSPLRLLDGFGQFVAPAPTARPIPTKNFSANIASQIHPPGLYGTDSAFQAHNLLKENDILRPFDPQLVSENISLRPYSIDGPIDLRDILFTIAFVLLILDTIAVLYLSGGWRMSQFRRTKVAVIACIVLFSPIILSNPTFAQNENNQIDIAKAIEATTKTRLAYVITGNSEIDQVSEQGLQGLSFFLSSRTSLNSGSPVGVDINQDELSYFPLIYWPIDPNIPTPSSRTIAKIDAFMRDGGTILFDTRDQVNAYSGLNDFVNTPASLKLRAILGGLDIPTLEPVPSDHVLTKSFYLLQEFPGRWSGGQLWVEAISDDNTSQNRIVRSGDGVSPIIITSNDFASAWAIDSSNNYLFPVVPPDPRQRELAFRTGTNIVMYTLTGNYKADQVHIPELLERLGQ